MVEAWGFEEDEQAFGRPQTPEGTAGVEPRRDPVR
jgi:hypothetical protein